jgi:uncharacterized protein with GYD domain
MPTFVSLVNWTDQGIKNYRDSVRRAEDYRGLVEKHGGQVRQLVWTLGEYDRRSRQHPDQDHEGVRR